MYSVNSYQLQKKSLLALHRFILISIILIISLLGACATNPVTGKTEFHLISESEEIKMGEKNYLYSQQSQGGEYIIDTELTHYVDSVGKRLAEVSDRPNLPYEFVVLNNSVPNAWALPGGKIAVNRGLLVELKSEAELAAVLGHEIVHAAARHGAKSIERGIMLQAGVIGVGLAVSDSKYSNIAVGASSVGAALISRKYGRGAELESDYHGMKYMSGAGYYTKAAISLQETFVRLSKNKNPNWLEGLFATHPPSQERVDANRVTAANLPSGGVLGIKEYQSEIAGLKKNRPAYEAHDKGRKSLSKGEPSKAINLANKAISIEPREAFFYGLRGDARVRKKQFRQSLSDYNEAIKRNNRFFQFYLQRGLVKERLGDIEGAKKDLQKSNSLFPTAHAHNSLGNISLLTGNRIKAIEHYRIASSSQSYVGKNAQRSLAKLELLQRPEKYIAVRKSYNRNGYVVVFIKNQSPLNVRNVAVDVVLYNQRGRIIKKDVAYFNYTMKPGRQYSLTTSVGPITSTQQLRQVGVKVIRAMIAE